MKLSLHRSIIFWSGILVMAFICWGWWNSAKMVSSASFKRVGMRHSLAGVSAFVRSFSLDDEFHFAHSPRGSYDYELGEPWLGRPEIYQPAKHPETWSTISWAEVSSSISPADVHFFYAFHPVSGRGEKGVFVPHWLLLLTVAVPWTGLLLWRARRIRKAAVIA